MYSNIALNTEIAELKMVIDELEVELRTIAKDERELDRELALYGRIIERTNYLNILLKEKNRLFDQGRVDANKLTVR